MTTRPELDRRGSKAVGLLAFVLFVVMSAVFLTAEFGSAAGFPGGGSITAAIGYAMFNLDAGAFPSEGFIVAFEVIDLVLVAALAVAVMLARRDDGGLNPFATDGGRDESRPARTGRDEDDGGDR